MPNTPVHDELMRGFVKCYVDVRRDHVSCSSRGRLWTSHDQQVVVTTSGCCNLLAFLEGGMQLIAIIGLAKEREKKKIKRRNRMGETDRCEH